MQNGEGVPAYLRNFVDLFLVADLHGGGKGSNQTLWGATTVAYNSDLIVHDYAMTLHDQVIPVNY